ncbi:MAG: PHP domain-containing protein [Candidatus Abyssobacteria bacterium SURF_5]|uniref:PHP domain-containing protein n=1 Tax=Abyssobacteria bacterium (strain SURF_5) TaxID=2093360 RepID=A0A3A4NV60_ABYX5|nr:MAG: PHP domain-containing protein [Candidatus Abyssubacteria bacterium SURF_5]
MIIDLHCHTVYSGDSNLEPEQLIETARRKGIEAVCITEHDSYLASEPAEEVAEKMRFPIFRGVEINTNWGHILAFGLRDDAWRENGYYTNIETVRIEIQKCGGILIPSHPFRVVGSASAQAHLFSMKFIAAVEVLNGENTPRENQLARSAWQKLGIPGTGGSDCHYVSKVGACATWFQNPVHSLEELIREIRSARVAPAYPARDGSYTVLTG